VQILLDGGFNNVSRMKGGIDAWATAGFPLAIDTSYSIEDFTRVLTPFSLTSSGDKDTPIPIGSIIFHWANKVTEVVGPDSRRVLVALDLEASTITTSSGEVRPVTWIYLLPQGTKTVQGDSREDFYQGDRLILSVITKSEDYIK
jgi:hypothetical protein